jgi:hypothetical protein
MNRPIYHLNLHFGNEHHIISANENAMPLLEQYPELIDKKMLSHNEHAIYLLDQTTLNWDDLCYNPNAIHLLRKNLNKISTIGWIRLSANPNAISILEQHIDKICWFKLSSNINAIHLLNQYKDKIDWDELSNNEHAIPILEQNIDKICWPILSGNSNAISILEQNQDKINWSRLSMNPKAIHMLEKNMDKINWVMLSKNQEAIHLLKQNPSKIDWFMVGMNPRANELIHLRNGNRVNCLYFNNPSLSSFVEDNLYTFPVIFSSIFTNPNLIHLYTKYNYEKMKENFSGMNQELTAHIFKPSRLVRLSEKYGITFSELVDTF